MLSTEKSFKQIKWNDRSEAEEPVKKQQNPRSIRPHSETSVSDARHEHEALLSEISQDFDQDEDIGPNINQQLADIINER